MDPINDEIKRRADLVEVVSQYVALRPAGRDRFKACCPFHDEKTPSFNVLRDRGFYNCFGCGKKGDVFKFVQEIENISFPEARRQLAERYGVTLPSFGRELTPEQQAHYDERDRLLKVTAAAATFFREQFAGNKGLEARDYARQRRLSPQTLEKFGIGYAPDAWDTLQHHLQNRYGFTPAQGAAAGLLVEKEGEVGKTPRFYDRFRHRLMFPIWDAQGRVVAFGGRALEGGDTGTPDAKYLNSPEGPLFSKSRTLYALHLARAEIGKRESIVVTEGYMDAIALHEAGFSHAIATLGTSLTTQHVAAIARLAPKVVYLCYDGDSAGMRAALRSAPLFSTHDLNVRAVLLPPGEDPDTYVKKNGPQLFEKALGSAKLLSRYRLEIAVAPFDLRNVSERIEAISAAAEVISEVENDIERDDYVAWTAERWSAAEGITTGDRLRIMQAAVRREVNAAAKRRRSQPAGAQLRQRDEESKDVNATLATASGAASGVAGTERILLTSLLANSMSRTLIMDSLPPQRWTEQAHQEIARALVQKDFAEPVDASELIETLSPAAAAIVTDLLMSDELQDPASEKVVADCIKRVNLHWAQQVERETLEMVQIKLTRGEEVTEAERVAHNAALIATGRKRAPAVQMG